MDLSPSPASLNVVCRSRLLHVNLTSRTNFGIQTNSVDQEHTAPLGAVEQSDPLSYCLMPFTSLSAHARYILDQYLTWITTS